MTQIGPVVPPGTGLVTVTSLDDHKDVSTVIPSSVTFIDNAWLLLDVVFNYSLISG